MTSTLAHWLAALALAIVRGPRIAWLRLEIWETEAYLRDCERDGLVNSLHIAEWRGRLAQMRVQLALLQPARRTTASATTTERAT